MTIGVFNVVPLDFVDNTTVTLTYTFEKVKLQGELEESMDW